MDSNTLRSISLKEAWKSRPDYHGQYGSKIHNSWRAIRFTVKGKKIGCSSEWEIFANFYKDMHQSYSDGLAICRKNKDLPFSKENCFWTEKANLATPTAMLEYNGETKLLSEWCLQYGVFYPAARQRYFKGKKGKYNSHEVLFGKEN